MLYLTEDDVGHVLRMADAIRAVDAGLQARARHTAVATPRERTRTPAGTLNILQGATAPDVGITGFKAYYATPQQSRSHTFLYDSASGTPLAILESNRFNVVRTGAATGAATQYLARPDAAVLGQLGAGRIGAGQLEAVCAVRKLREARVYAPTRDKLEAWCIAMTEKVGIPVLPAASGEAAVRGADIVNVITRATAPVLPGDWLEAGQHVNAAGANQLLKRELHADALRRFDLVVADSREVARKEGGELLPLVESGRLQWEALAEIGDIAAGLHPGRTDPKQITFYKSHGMALQDLYVAAGVLAEARRMGLGHEIPGT